MPKLKKCVVTIHGINTRGEWQGAAEKVLKPHFECVAIKYPDYENLWLTLNAGVAHWSVYAAVIALLGFSITAITGVVPWVTAGLMALTLVVLLIIVGVWHAKLRRRVVIERIRGMIEDAIQPQFHPRPHMIAHSMGTYLSMRSLEGFATVMVDRVVLVGAVLPRKFDWSGLRRARRNAFREVRNEMGEADWVVWLVGRIAGILPEFGDSGRRGFLGETGWLHAIAGPLGPCDDCTKSATKAWVHNVPLGTAYGHSTHFLRESHCEDLWLPFLWGFDPDELVRFRNMCLDVLLFESDGDWISAEQMERELRRSEWAWTMAGGVPHPLEDYVSDAIRARLTELNVGFSVLQPQQGSAECAKKYAIS